jgi:hypothetical protein
MKRLAGILSIAALGLGLAACDTGTAGDDVQGDDTEDRITCMADLDLTGSFAIGYPQPAEISGCWPIGTWTFTATVVNNTCTDTPTLEPSYAFRVDRDTGSADPDYMWLYSITSPAQGDAHNAVKVSSGGGGLCEGGMQIYSSDGKQEWNLHPSLNADASLDGIGTFQIHTTDVRPPLGGA